LSDKSTHKPTGLVEAWNAYKVSISAMPQTMKAAEIGFAAGYKAAMSSRADAVGKGLREALKSIAADCSGADAEAYHSENQHIARTALANSEGTKDD
jgi:hypothetical protein